MKYIVTRNRGPLRVRSDFDQLFGNLWNDWSMSNTRLPAVDVREEEKAYIIEAELPGYCEKDVDVHVDKHVLKISSLVKAEQEEKSEEQENLSYLVRERSCHSFERSFTLPEGVDEDKITGEFKNGLLTIVVPKVAEKQPKKIDVKIK